MVKHNNIIQNNHYIKGWHERVTTWFNQPARKVRRRNARAAKAAAVFPRPTQLLRPLVRCPTSKYNNKQRLGRGFTHDELKAAGIKRSEALTIGIAVDPRRQAKSEESFQENVQRLKTYKSKLVLFPRKSADGRKNAWEAASAQAKQIAQQTGTLLKPTTAKAVTETRKVTAEDKAFNAYATLRKARSDAKYVGVREKRAADKKRKEDEAAAAGGKKK